MGFFLYLCVYIFMVPLSYQFPYYIYEKNINY